eukprot:GHRR01022082.1.p1 GENE.GHRR01022082.1~~GHRR01022082.1.p1  ORF type:complete len:278 (+),score=107.40 GHRR01022082.1:190-1023(+)
MSASIQAALDEAGKVVKKQKLCTAKVGDSLDKLIELVQSCWAKLSAGSANAIRELQAQAEKQGLMKDMNSSTKELHSSINKLSKALDKAFDNQQDVCKALREASFDQQTLNKVIAEHLYREGRFELADEFVQEAALPGADELKAPYVALHTVLQQIRHHNLAPALEWAQQHRAKLSPNADSPSSFEFNLHSLSFLNLLTAAGQTAALQYAQQHFAPFKARHMREIQRLMGCLLYADRDPEDTPYADLLSPTRWDEVAKEFSRPMLTAPAALNSTYTA